MMEKHFLLLTLLGMVCGIRAATVTVTPLFTVVPGRLLVNNDKFFDWLNTFLVYMRQNQAAVDVVSLQNEPD